MKSVLFLAFIALTALETVYAVSCPKCTDPYNPDSCTGEVVCHNVHDICELRVHANDRNRLEYLCFNSHACTNHEAHSCISGVGGEYCSYCCKSADACKAQRDQLFSTLFTTTATKAPATTMPTTAPSALTTDANSTAQTTDDMTTVPMTNTTN